MQSGITRKFDQMDSTATLRRPGIPRPKRLRTARPDMSPSKSSHKNQTPALPKAPGPGSYEHPIMFPSGPKATIQTKKRQDSWTQQAIDRAISPGPATHASMDAPNFPGQGSKVIPFGDAKRFVKNQSGSLEFSNTDAGPGAYDTNSVNHLKREPRVMIPTQPRFKRPKDLESGSPPR